MPLLKAKEPFKFYTRLTLPELTGLRAYTLRQLVQFIKKVPDSCIYQHTHRFLQQHQYLSPEPPNDFAYWVSNILVEKELGEQLASIDTIQFSTIDRLRAEIVSVIERYLRNKPSAGLRFARVEEAFYFIKSISFILPTNYIANDLKEFVAILKNITLDSIYFHIFEARLRLGHGMNDFSNWIKSSLDNNELANQISGLDPYTYTLEELRNIVIMMVERAING
jgi:hypothetical protein